MPIADVRCGGTLPRSFPRILAPVVRNPLASLGCTLKRLHRCGLVPRGDLICFICYTASLDQLRGCIILLVALSKCDNGDARVWHDCLLRYIYQRQHCLTDPLLTHNTTSVAQDGNPNFWNDPSSASAITYYLVIFILFCTLFPVFISLFTGGGSVYHMCRNIVPFYLFLPTLVSTFGAYAFARTFDLTWGNRPPSEIEAVTNATKRQAVEKAQTKLKEQSQASCTFIVILNLVIVFLGLMTIHINWVVLGAVACIFFPSLVQMIISFFWYVRFFIVRCLRQVLFFLSVIFCCKCDYCCWCCRTKIFRSDKRLDAQLSWQRDTDLEAATKDSKEDSPETSKTNLINQA